MATVADAPTPESEMVALERGALALWLLMQAPYSTQSMAERLGLSRQGARWLLTTISRVVPIYYHEGLWQMCDDK